jgi:hypothetical protein
MADNLLTIDCAPSGRNGNATLTAKLAGEVLAVESVNLTKPKARTEFVARLCDGRQGIDAQAVEAKLLQLAADVATKPETQANPTILPELDAAAIVRPERFITPEVSGLAVPSMTTMGDKPVGRWLLYLRWADGKRELRLMAPSVDLPDGRRLFIHPEPSEPTPSTKPGWSAAARRRWSEGEPAPDPAALFKAMAALFARFIDLPTAHAAGVTATALCWAMLSYIYTAFPAVPYLFVGGPLGSGKSRLFEVLSRLVFRPLSSSNMTGAALFRTLHSQGGVLLLDEAERLKNTTDPATAEILSMLLAGYKKGGAATRLEPVGDSGFKTLSFDVFGPKALACIAGLPPALASRSIPVTMFRSPPGSEKPRRRIDHEPEGWQRLRDDLHALALEHGPTWLELPERTDVCPAMSGRDYELWQPLLALAWWIEQHGARGLLKMLQDHALATIDAGRDDATPDADETLLRILTEEIRAGMVPTPGDILAKALATDAAAFKTWKARGVSEHLKRYGATTHKSCGRKVYRVTLDSLRAIQASYGIDLGFDEIGGQG